MITVYGLKNCSTVKKACAWLEERSLDYHFHDFRADGVSLTQLIEFEEIFGWERLLNKRSTTWRELPPAEKQNLTRDSALQLLIAHPALIKRPALKSGSVFLLGFNADEYQSKL
jgi:arsenate reductase